ncbi:MAG: phosphoribosylformylglycinamidine synthase subunit PurQ [Acidobacteriota bacterium]|jgi:phosphoribosylformylglycinamidine synthase|nr:phosphoribosylformylglycinamidine synthase subunit PurQ [Acidobacteriota bacterium]
MASDIPVLIITGYGLNCEVESSVAWEMAGARPERVHLSDLVERPSRLGDYAALMFVGGFSYGDHMGSGHVFALRVRRRLGAELEKFIRAGKLVLGVCNGFQIMVKLGLLPGIDGEWFAQKLSIMQNDCGTFQNRWTPLRFEPDSPCVFTKGLAAAGLARFPLPVRHGEGKVFTPDRKLLERLEALGCVPCRYADPETGEATQEFPYNPNGALNAIAGLCDPTGRVFGLMPHPEAYLYPENHPRWDLQKMRGELPTEGLGLSLFRNAVEHLRRL